MRFGSLIPPPPQKKSRLNSSSNQKKRRTKRKIALYRRFTLWFESHQTLNSFVDHVIDFQVCNFSPYHLCFTVTTFFPNSASLYNIVLRFEQLVRDQNLHPVFLIGWVDWFRCSTAFYHKSRREFYVWVFLACYMSMHWIRYGCNF